MIQTVLTRTKYTTFPFAHNNKCNTDRAVVSSCSTIHQIKVPQSAASDLHCKSQLIKNLILLLIIALFIKPTAFLLNTQTNTYQHAWCSHSKQWNNVQTTDAPSLSHSQRVLVPLIIIFIQSSYQNLHVFWSPIWPQIAPINLADPPYPDLYSCAIPISPNHHSDFHPTPLCSYTGSLDRSKEIIWLS
jgi:hypothetical protein